MFNISKNQSFNKIMLQPCSPDKISESINKIIHSCQKMVILIHSKTSLAGDNLWLSRKKKKTFNNYKLKKSILNTYSII